MAKDSGIQYPIQVDLKGNEAFQKLGKEVQYLVDSLKVVNSHLSVAQTVMGGVSSRSQQLQGDMRGVANSAKESGSSIDSFRGTLERLAAFVGLEEIGRHVIKIGADMEQTRIAYDTLLGSATEGGEMLKQLKEWSDVSSFTPAVTYDTGKMLLAYGIEAKNLLPTLNNLSDLSMGSLEKFQRVTEVYARGYAKQKVDAREIMQLQSAGLNFYTGMEKALNLKKGEGRNWFLEHEKSGEGIGIAQLNAAIMALTGKGGMFEGMTEKMSQTVNVKWTTALGQLEEVAVNTFEKLKGPMKEFLDFGIKYIPVLGEYFIKFFEHVAGGIKWMQQHKELMKDIGKAVGELAVAYGLWVAGLKLGVLWEGLSAMGMFVYNGYLLASAGALDLAAIAQWGLNAAMDANPIGVVILAGAALGKVVYDTTANLQDMNAQLDKAGNKIDWDPQIEKLSKMQQWWLGMTDAVASYGAALAGIEHMATDKLFGTHQADEDWKDFHAYRAEMASINDGTYGHLSKEAAAKKNYQGPYAIGQSPAAIAASWKGLYEKVEASTNPLEIPKDHNMNSGVSGTGAAGNPIAAGLGTVGGSGGNQVRNITTNINQLVGSVHISYDQMKHDARKVKTEFEDMLISIIRDGEVALAS